MTPPQEVKDAIPDFRLKGLGQLALQSGIVLTHAMPSPIVARKSDSLVSLGIPEPPVKVVRQGSALYRSNSNAPLGTKKKEEEKSVAGGVFFFCLLGSCFVCKA